MSAHGEEAVECVREALERIAAELDAEAEVRVRHAADAQGEDVIVGEFLGTDVGPLIGHHGQTLDAIQHLVYRIAFRKAGRPVRILVDAGGYRERRAAALRATADQAAEAAVQDRRPVPLDAMSALERRVIHEHLKDRHDIETYSEGQEPDRYLVVAPLVD